MQMLYEIGLAINESLDPIQVVDEILNPGASNHMTDEVVMRYHTEVHEQRGGPWSAKQWL